MTIQTVSLEQQHQYQQQTTSQRKIKRITAFDGNQGSTQLPNKTINKQIANVSASNQVSTSELQAGILALNRASSASNTSDNIEDIYHRPLPVKVKLMKLILENYLGKNLDLSNQSLSYQKSSAQQFTIENISKITHLSSQQLSPNSDLISLDGKTFNRQDQIEVSTISQQTQQLNFSMQGDFIIDNQAVNLNYQLQLNSQYSTASTVNMSAAALKDPLVIQYGAQSIGKIIGYQALDINNDKQQDNLPIFSGDVGYLVYDKNNDQQVNNGSELFGPTSNNGFAELAMLDSNQNGYFDQQDDKYQQVYIWQPKHMNSAEEQNLVTLSQAGIKAISLNAIDTQFNFRGDHGEIDAQLTQSSFAITNNNQAVGVHQIDVRL